MRGDAVESDRVLVRRMLAGDAAAFEQFFETAFPVLFRFALVRVRFDEDAAHDIAQEAICRALGKLHTFRGEAALLTWLCTFCRHELYAHGLRHDGRTPVALLEDEPEIRAALESLRASGTDDDPDSAFDRSRLSALVQQVLDHLPAHYADALEWKYIDEVSVREIGQRLDLSTKAAESLLTRARRSFRDAFQTLTSTLQPAGTRHARGDT